ncbi:hypothetical protein [Mycobacterium tilburgii]|nr:hypothetical protein [Mycobacterium tilburgii]
MSGNDSLTAEGQLEQAQKRRKANGIDAVAEQQAERARAHEAEAKIEGA